MQTTCYVFAKNAQVLIKWFTFLLIINNTHSRQIECCHLQNSPSILKPHHLAMIKLGSRLRVLHVIKHIKQILKQTASNNYH